MSNTRKATGVKPAAQDVQPTPVSSWKKEGTVLALPSGNAIRLRNPGIMELAHQGLVPNSLMNLIMTMVKKGQEPKLEDVMTEDLDVAGMLAMMDNSIMQMAVEPEIHPVPVWEPEDVEEGICGPNQLGKPAESKKDSGLLYINDVNEEDKMFIWSWATGGPTDVEQFRKESGNVLAAVSGKPPVASKAKRAPARKK